MKLNYWHSEGWPEKNGSGESVGISITDAKRLLRKRGGTAVTCFFDRDGGLLETRKIELNGNNTRKARLSNSGGKGAAPGTEKKPAGG
jgi:hypothetical protein